MAEKGISIHVKYGDQTCIFNTKREEFLSKVAAKFKINEEDIEIYEHDKTSKKKISVDKLRDFISVEIAKKLPVSTIKINGQRSLEDNGTSKVATICQKLKGNNPLTEKERELLYFHLLSLPPSVKRTLEDGNPHPVETKNRKIQASPIDEKSAYTQTDKLIEFSRASNSTSENNVDEEMKRYAKKDKRDPAKVEALMKKTFDDRRNFILVKKPMVQFVKEKYPLLFTLSEVRNEIDRICCGRTSEEFIDKIEKFAEIILSMPSDVEPLLLTTRKKEEMCTTQNQKKYAVQVGSILMLSKLTGESRKYLKLQDTSFDPGNLPYIECEATLNELFFDKYTFKIYTENILLCEAGDFKEAILCLVASYFIFNINYPDHDYNTMVIMEKLFLGGNDTDLAEVDEDVQQIIKTLELKLKAKQRSK